MQMPISFSFVSPPPFLRLSSSLSVPKTYSTAFRSLRHLKFPAKCTMPPPNKRQKRDLRCPWALSAPDYIDYHDKVWGVPLYDDQKVFEFLILETFQAGLSWLTILRKQSAFAQVFHSFDVDRVAAMTDDDVRSLLNDNRIIRHERKIRAAINNAQIVKHMRDQGIGLAHYFWQWVDYVPQTNLAHGSLLSKNKLSDTIAKDLKKKGFKFVGSTVIYAHLQATGVINDHHSTCPRFKQVQALVRPSPSDAHKHKESE